MPNKDPSGHCRKADQVERIGVWFPESEGLCFIYGGKSPKMRSNAKRGGRYNLLIHNHRVTLPLSSATFRIFTHYRLFQP